MYALESSSRWHLCVSPMSGYSGKEKGTESAIAKRTQVAAMNIVAPKGSSKTSLFVSVSVSTKAKDAVWKLGYTLPDGMQEEVNANMHCRRLFAVSTVIDEISFWIDQTGFSNELAYQ